MNKKPNECTFYILAACLSLIVIGTAGCAGGSLTAREKSAGMAPSAVLRRAGSLAPL